MKVLLFVMVLTEMFLAVLAFSDVFIDRKSSARAFVEWKNNPTPENKGAWEQEAALSKREGYIVDIFRFGLLIANTVGLIVLIRKIRKPSIS